MAGTITHYWNGTQLVVTSDSGTSAADLSGATGPRGPQGRPGVIYDSNGNLYLDDIPSGEEVEALEARMDRLENSHGVTTEYVATKIEAELADYYTKEQTDAKLDNVSVDLTGYATETYVQDYVKNNASGGASVDLSNYATKNYVNNAVANVEADVDLSNYPTYDDMSAAIAQAQLGGSGDGSGVDLSAFATNTYVNELADGTSIQFRNGHISTAFGGNVIGYEGGEALGGGTPTLVTRPYDDNRVFFYFIGTVSQTTSSYYDVSFTINDELFEVNHIFKNEMVEAYNNAYFDGVTVEPDGGATKLVLWVKDTSLAWTDNTMLTAQFSSAKVNVYDPIDANALPIDNSLIIVKDDKITLAMDYATYEYVDAAIANAGGSGGNVDLSNYYTKSEIDNKIANAGTVDLSNYYTKAQTQAYVLEQRMSIEAWVLEQIAAGMGNIGSSEEVEY